MKDFNTDQSVYSQTLTRSEASVPVIGDIEVKDVASNGLLAIAKGSMNSLPEFSTTPEQLTLENRLLQLETENSALRTENEELKKRFERDFKTGAYTHQFYSEHTLSKLERYIEHRQSTYIDLRFNSVKYAFMFIDIDNMRGINSAIGHANADIIIKKVANVLQGSLRDEDMLIRNSDAADEFLVLLEIRPETEETTDIVESIQARIENGLQEITDQTQLPIDVSLGHINDIADFDSVKSAETAASFIMKENKDAKKQKLAENGLGEMSQGVFHYNELS